jgi:lipoate-protein ligase A
MKYIDVKTTDPAINLALEQYVFDVLSEEDDFFLLWQNDNAIIIGKNQNTYTEINEDYVKQHSIKVVRRLSGGGAVYHDLGNLNFTFIVKESRKQFEFSQFCRPVIRVLQELGVNAEINGRNDMVIDAKKFSGNAQYFKNGKILHHGTLMYDSDIEVIGSSLKVNAQKIVSKGVKSIISHVTNIRPYMKEDVPILKFKELLADRMALEYGLEKYELTKEDLNQIQKIALQRYAAWEWNYGKSPEFKIRRQKRYEGCGQIELCMDVQNGHITGFDIYGDYFSYQDKEGLCKAVTGCTLNEEDIRKRLRNVDVGSYIHNFSNDKLIELILSDIS